MQNMTTKPLLIFGGSYSNLQATKALQQWSDDHGFAAEQIICTGDMVAYCAKPFETIELIRTWLGDEGHCIQGNAEQSLAESSGDCGCGFAEGSACDALSRDWFSYTEQQVTQQQRDWFSELPFHLNFDYHGHRMSVVHGAPSKINRFIYDSQEDADFIAEFSAHESNPDVIIAGHSGLPFTKNIDMSDGQHKIWHNSGALGMPANDGTARVWFSVLDVDSDGELIIEHHALEYDAQLSQQEMIEVGLTQGYELALINGIWPSMDVLPELERSQQGIPLNK